MVGKNSFYIRDGLKVRASPLVPLQASKKFEVNVSVEKAPANVVLVLGKDCMIIGNTIGAYDFQCTTFAPVSTLVCAKLGVGVIDDINKFEESLQRENFDVTVEKHSIKPGDAKFTVPSGTPFCVQPLVIESDDMPVIFLSFEESQLEAVDLPQYSQHRNWTYHRDMIYPLEVQSTRVIGCVKYKACCSKFKFIESDNLIALVPATITDEEDSDFDGVDTEVCPACRTAETPEKNIERTIETTEALRKLCPTLSMWPKTGTRLMEYCVKSESFSGDHGRISRGLFHSASKICKMATDLARKEKMLEYETDRVEYLTFQICDGISCDATKTFHFLQRNDDNYLSACITFSEPAIFWNQEENEKMYVSYQLEHRIQFVVRKRYLALPADLNNASTRIPVGNSQRKKCFHVQAFLRFGNCPVRPANNIEVALCNIPHLSLKTLKTEYNLGATAVIEIQKYNCTSSYVSSVQHLAQNGFMLIKLNEAQKETLINATQAAQAVDNVTWSGISSNIGFERQTITTMLESNEQASLLFSWRQQLNAVIENICDSNEELKKPQKFFHTSLRSPFLNVEEPQSRRILSAQVLHCDIAPQVHLSDEEKDRLFHCCIVTHENESGLLVQPRTHIPECFEAQPSATKFLELPKWSILLFHGYLIHAGTRHYSDANKNNNDYHYRSFVYTSLDSKGERLETTGPIQELDRFWFALTPSEEAATRGFESSDTDTENYVESEAQVSFVENQGGIKKMIRRLAFFKEKRGECGNILDFFVLDYHGNRKFEQANIDDVCAEVLSSEVDWERALVPLTKKISKDGNCLFTAMSEFQGNNWNHEKMRKELVEWIEKNDEKEKFMEKACVQETLTNYCKKMRKIGTFGDFVVLLAYAHKFKVRVEVIQHDNGALRFASENGKECVVNRFMLDMGESDKKTREIIRAPHYDMIIERDEIDNVEAVDMDDETKKRVLSWYLKRTNTLKDVISWFKKEKNRMKCETAGRGWSAYHCVSQHFDSKRFTGDAYQIVDLWGDLFTIVNSALEDNSALVTLMKNFWNSKIVTKFNCRAVVSFFEASKARGDSVSNLFEFFQGPENLNFKTTTSHIVALSGDVSVQNTLRDEEGEEYTITTPLRQGQANFVEVNSDDSMGFRLRKNNCNDGEEIIVLCIHIFSGPRIILEEKDSATANSSNSSNSKRKQEAKKPPRKQRQQRKRRRIQ